MLEELKAKKKNLEQQIHQLIREFEDETGAYVSDINILHNVWQTTNGREIKSISVEAEIKF